MSDDKTLFLAFAILIAFLLIYWRRLSTSVRWQLGTLGGVGVFALWHMLVYSTLADDAFITFRYSLNLAQGHGPVFNPGEKVEGYSDFSWMVLIAIPKMLWNGDIVMTARVLGVLFSLACVALVYDLVRRLSGNGALGLLAATVTAASGSFAAYAMAGLETPLFAFLVLGVLWLALTERFLLTGLCAGLTILTRPDGAVVAGVVFVWALAQFRAADGLSRLLRYSGGVVAIAGPWMIWRTIYYGGYFLPNAVAAKSGATLGWMAQSGWAYFLAFLGTLTVLLAGVPIALYLLITRRRSVDPAVFRILCLSFAIGIFYSTFVVLTGGDWMPAWRMLVMPIPVFAVGVFATLGALTVAWPAVVMSRLVPVAVATMGAILLTNSVTDPDMTSRVASWHVAVRNLGSIGSWLGSRLPPGSTISTYANGALSFKAGTSITVVDVLGLTDEHIARSGNRNSDGIIGHMANDYPYVVDVRRPIVAVMDGNGFYTSPTCDVNGPFQKAYQPALYQITGQQKWMLVYLRNDVAPTLARELNTSEFHLVRCPTA